MLYDLYNKKEKMYYGLLNFRTFLSVSTLELEFTTKNRDSDLNHINIVCTFVIFRTQITTHEFSEWDSIIKAEVWDQSLWTKRERSPSCGKSEKYHRYSLNSHCPSANWVLLLLLWLNWIGMDWLGTWIQTHLCSAPWSPLMGLDCWSV